MTEPDVPAEKDPSSDLLAKPFPESVRIPASLWVWLAILIATYALPGVLAMQGSGTKIVEKSGVSSAGFAELSQAEYQTRLALAPLFSEAIAKADRPDKTASSVQTAANSYRVLATKNKSVVSARKVLVLEHLRKKPLDEPFLTGVLARNLSGRGTKAGAISSELALWRSLYGSDAKKNFRPSDAGTVIARIKTYRLALLEPQAVADVYTLAGRKADADRVTKAMQTKVTGEIIRLLLIFLLLGCASLVGLVFLTLFASAWVGRNWRNVARVSPQTADTPGVAAPFGALMDVFVAYLAISRGVGLLVGVLPLFDAVPPVYLSALVYVGTGVLAALYLAHQARTHRWNLPALGLGGINGTNILYGVAGYCAALPVTFLLGFLNTRFFKNSESALAPNPVLPMIAGEGSEIGRLVLFCLVAVAAPVFEELFFRGVLYPALKTRFPTVACVVISAACFAVVHPMGDWLPIFGLGCALATVRELRQSVVPGIVMHFCQNAMAFTLMSSVFGR